MARRPTAMDTPRSIPMREEELAARWAAGAWRGATLRTLSGATYRLIYEGRRNGGPGPDFRDAALEADGWDARARRYRAAPARPRLAGARTSYRPALQ